jgi:hypothetical protein
MALSTCQEGRNDYPIHNERLHDVERVVSLRMRGKRLPWVDLREALAAHTTKRLVLALCLDRPHRHRLFRPAQSPRPI